MLAIAATVLASIGVAGAIVLGLANWLGKVWASRLMEADRAQHAKEFEELRAELTKTTESELASLKHELEIYKEKHLQGYVDKLAIYRSSSDVIVEMLAVFDEALPEGKPLSVEDRVKFNRSRMQVYGYLAMLAPQSVMDAFDNLVGLLLGIIEGSSQYEWPLVREKVLIVINEVRKDIGIDSSPIEYRGGR